MRGMRFRLASALSRRKPPVEAIWLLTLLLQQVVATGTSHIVFITEVRTHSDEVTYRAACLDIDRVASKMGIFGPFAVGVLNPHLVV